MGGRQSVADGFRPPLWRRGRQGWTGQADGGCAAVRGGARRCSEQRAASSASARWARPVSAGRDGTAPAAASGFLFGVEAGGDGAAAGVGAAAAAVRARACLRMPSMRLVPARACLCYVWE